MHDLDRLLLYIQRTNPAMTKDKLIKKLNESYVSSSALVMTFTCSNAK